MTAFLLPRKGIAFLKRDFLDAASYKLSFLYSLIGVFFSSATFFFISKLIAPGAMSLNAYGGDYFSFAMIDRRRTAPCWRNENERNYVSWTVKTAWSGRARKSLSTL